MNGFLARGFENEATEDSPCRVPDSAQMGECVQQLAAKYTRTKFVKIISNDCIPDYPDRNLPTLLIYKDTECKHNLVGKLPFGGRLSPEGALSAYLSHVKDVPGNYACMHQLECPSLMVPSGNLLPVWKVARVLAGVAAALNRLGPICNEEQIR